MSQAVHEEAARAVARWLAPYVAAELGRSPEPEISGSYDDQTCAVFVSNLGDVVLDNAEPFFEALASDGEIGSLDLAAALGVASPRNIPAILTTPLKRRAKALGLSNPWMEGSRGDRTVWHDDGGIAARMLQAVRAEKQRRGTRRHG
jgi:hypothetical protein